MDGRDAFLTLAREKHYEFSSLRRAKYSTMSMLYELHNQGQDRFVYTCNNCKAHVETRYHCTFCEDFDLCTHCYEKNGHQHKMEKLGFDLDDGTSPSEQNKTNPQEARKLSIQVINSGCFFFISYANLTLISPALYSIVGACVPMSRRKLSITELCKDEACRNAYESV